MTSQQMRWTRCLFKDGDVAGWGRWDGLDGQDGRCKQLEYEIPAGMNGVR